MKWSEIEADTRAREAELLRWLAPYGFVPSGDLFVPGNGAIAEVVAINPGMSMWLEHVSNGNIQATDKTSVHWRGPTIRIIRRMGFDNTVKDTGSERVELQSIQWYKLGKEEILKDFDIIEFDYGLRLVSDENDDTGDVGVEHLHTYMQSFQVWQTDPDRVYQDIGEAVKFNDVVGDYMQSRLKSVDDDLDILDI